MIEVRALTRHFTVGGETVRALDGLDLSIGAGEYLSLMGPSGSGKSTLLQILGLLDRPTAGVYRLDGRDVTELDEETRTRVRGQRIGFVFQFFHLVPRLTAAENVALPLMLAGVTPPERTARVTAAMEAVGIANRAGHRPAELSAGQRQRTAIARATITEPAVLLADEPTGNLDRATGEDVIGLLESLNARGITLIVVTHDPAIGDRARRHIRLVDGRLDNGQPVGKPA